MIETNARAQIACAAGGLAFLAVFGVGFCLIAGLFPPPHASDSALQVARLCRDDTDRLRIGIRWWPPSVPAGRRPTPSRCTTSRGCC